MGQRFAASVGLPLMLGITPGGDRVETKDRSIRQPGLTYLGGRFHCTPPIHGVAGAW